MVLVCHQYSKTMQVKRECICIKGGAWIELACIPQAFVNMACRLFERVF